MKAESIDL